MAKKNYGKLEQKVINLFISEKNFKLNGKEYTTLCATKPTTSSGECKTDVYVLGESTDKEKIELKISVKTKSSNEFQENKCTAEKMEAYFGIGWAKIIENATIKLKDQFESTPLIYISGKHPTKPNSITLGWKLEIASKKRRLSTLMPLGENEIRDYVYKGTNQSDIKRNALINGKTIPKSGVAEYILVTEIDEISSTSDVLNQMQLIDTIKISPTYFIFTANNYRTMEDKADGKRALAVNINWECIDGKLTPFFQYNAPLLYTGEEDMKPKLLESLNRLKKNHPSELNVLKDVSRSEIVLI